MKNTIRKLTALALVLTMVLSMSALAAKETPSKGFKLPEVKPRETEVPAETEMPVATDVPVDSEATEAPADPEATEAPAGETEESAEPETVIGTAYVSLENADSTLNVRAAASTESERLGSLNNGDQVSVLGNEGEWTKISYAGAAGYVKSSYLSDSPATEEPAVEPTEEPAVEPTEEPAVEPTEEPAVEPTEEPAVEPTEEPVVEPTEEPAVEPTEEPAVEPTEVPELEATVEPEVTAEPEVTEEPAAEAEAVVETPITVGDADVRLEGDGLSEIFVTLPEGTELVVLEVVGDWVKVDIDGQIGYIYKDSVLGVEFEEPEVVDPEAEPVRKVTIFSSRRSIMAPGETVYLTSKLEGFEDMVVRYQWQCDKGDGEGFVDVADATADTYSFEADIETLSYDWRLAVFAKPVVEENVDPAA